jgi:hypothetical protein
MKNIVIPFSMTVILITSISLFAAIPRPWTRRVNRDVVVRHQLAYKNVRPDQWPAEPPVPATIDPVPFEHALGLLCGPMPEARATSYANTILQEAARFQVDPFLLGALVFERSGCRPKTHPSEKQPGITRIDMGMHAPQIRGGSYRYYLLDDGLWKPESLKLNRHQFNRWSLKQLEPNLYFAAAILKVFATQCPHLDRAFGGATHRHAVSHWFYGDRVRDTEPEDRILTLRRRLLGYYHGETPQKITTYRQVSLFAPLDGSPRLMLDFFGNRRGSRNGPGHRGIDIDAMAGEPVRAIAPGKVIFAGIDLPGKGRSRNLPPRAASKFPSANMGPGGRWVRIAHDNGFSTFYMHLKTVSIREGRNVKGGQKIGTAGRSGTVSSGPHLHLELRVGALAVDPAPWLAPVLVNPFSQPIK